MLSQDEFKIIKKRTTVLRRLCGTKPNSLRKNKFNKLITKTILKLKQNQQQNSRQKTIVNIVLVCFPY